MATHWITVARIHGSLVKVYDSKYETISEDSKQQIARLTATDKKIFTLKIHNFRKAPQIVDCMLLHLLQKYALEITLQATGLFCSLSRA